MPNGNASIMYAIVITPVLIGTVGTTRAESVAPRQLQAPTSRPSADMQIKLLLEHIEGHLGQDQANFDEVITLLVAACNLLPAASPTGQQMLSDLPQRLFTRSKEQREAGSVIKSINYEVFADSAHCTTSVKKQEPRERLDLTASQAATKQPPLTDPPSPHPSQEPMETNASAGTEADTSPVAITLPNIGKAPPPYQLSQQQHKPEEKMTVTAGREADSSSAAAAAPIGPSRHDPPIPERSQPETRMTRAATAGPPSASNASPSPQVTDQHSQDPSTLSLATQRTLMDRGNAMLNQRNVVAARLLFARAADAGVGIAALKLAQTYDSGFIADHNLIGIKGDQHEAEIWYRKAAALGERQAEQRLKALEERRKTLATQ